MQENSRTTKKQQLIKHSSRKSSRKGLKDILNFYELTQLDEHILAEVLMHFSKKHISLEFSLFTCFRKHENFILDKILFCFRKFHWLRFITIFLLCTLSIPHSFPSSIPSRALRTLKILAHPSRFLYTRNKLFTLILKCNINSPLIRHRSRS
ncbi:hypothetical protein V6Z11_1Z118700 [Gossypium hirsutum]